MHSLPKLFNGNLMSLSNERLLTGYISKSSKNFLKSLLFLVPEDNEKKKKTV